LLGITDQERQGSSPVHEERALDIGGPGHWC
jgi:hypothetical protein